MRICAGTRTVSRKMRHAHMVYISHRIPQLLEMANRILVLKGGQRVGIRTSSETSSSTRTEPYPA